MTIVASTGGRGETIHNRYICICTCICVYTYIQSVFVSVSQRRSTAETCVASSLSEIPSQPDRAGKFYSPLCLFSLFLLPLLPLLLPPFCLFALSCLSFSAAITIMVTTMSTNQERLKRLHLRLLHFLPSLPLWALGTHASHSSYYTLSMPLTPLFSTSPCSSWPCRTHAQLVTCKSIKLPAPTATDAFVPPSLLLSQTQARMGSAWGTVCLAAWGIPVAGSGKAEGEREGEEGAVACCYVLALICSKKQ